MSEEREVVRLNGELFSVKKGRDMSEEKDWVQEAAIRGALLDKAEARIAELEAIENDYNELRAAMRAGNVVVQNINGKPVCFSNRLEAEREWIPCSERLPEHEQPVLWWNGEKQQIGHLHIAPTWQSVDIHSEQCWQPLEQFSHWQPLPAAPEKQFTREDLVK